MRVNTEVMEQLARDFVHHIKDLHNGKKVFLTCDNLSAHFADSAKKISEGNVFICYLQPDLTEAVFSPMASES